MPDLPTPVASRLQKPSWRDSRLLVGVLLVLLVTVLGSVVVAHADDRVPMYAAKGPLVPGQQLAGSDVTRLDVQLADAGARYLSAGPALPANLYVLRELRPGELIPLSALGPAAAVHLQPVTLQVDATSASALVVGSVVDVYVNEPKPGGSSDDFEGPQRALEHVSVSRLPAESRGFGGGSDSLSVQVMAPTDTVKTLIGGVDSGAKITLVPVPGSRTRGDS